jgi:hypothetical protein
MLDENGEPAPSSDMGMERVSFVYDVRVTADLDDYMLCRMKVKIAYLDVE